MIEVEHVAADDSEATVLLEGLEVPFAARGEVVEDGHDLRLRVAEESFDEVAADESGTTDDDDPGRRDLPDGRTVGLAGCLHGW